MTNTTKFDQTIASLREKVAEEDVKNPEDRLIRYIKAVEVKKGMPGLYEHYLKNGSAPASTPAPVRANSKVPAHVMEKLGEISVKFEKPMEELITRWETNMADPAMDEMDLEGEEREKEAWLWVHMNLTHATTMGGQKSQWEFTLYYRDENVGSWQKWEKKPGQDDPKNQIQVEKGVASGFGMFRRRKEGEEDEVVVSSITAFEDGLAHQITNFAPFTTYEGPLTKGKGGFGIPDPVPEYKEIGEENVTDFTKLLLKYVDKMVIQPSFLDEPSARVGKKAKNFVLDCRILQASSDVTDNGTEYSTLKVMDGDADPMAEPRVFYIKFWRDDAVKAFLYNEKSRVYVSCRVNKSEGYDNANLNGQWIMPKRASIATRPSNVVPYEEPGA